MVSPQQSVTPVGGSHSSPLPQGSGLLRVGKYHRVALLIDGEWFRRALEKHLRPRPPRGSTPATTPPRDPLPHGITAAIFYKNALATLALQEEECFRIFYYDAEPFKGKITNPIDGTETDCGATPGAASRMRFFRELGAMELVALRRGECRARGWQIREDFLKTRIRSGNAPVTITAADISHTLEQKGVDMRIGMDVATLSLKRIVDRIIVISGDTDLIPALKLARREGLQVGVVRVGTTQPHPTLVEDSDFVRIITPTAH